MFADRIIVSNRVFTGMGDTAQPLAIIIRGNHVFKAVSPDKKDAYIGPDTIVEDYGDAFICAGFHDSHMHVFHSSLYSSPLAEQFLGENEEDCVKRLEPLARRRPTGWLLAQGWREYRWNPPVLPSKRSLDAAYPDRPVALYSGDAHTLWLNSCALETLGITCDSVAPAGGSYDTDETGELTGIIREAAAMELMPRIVASFTTEELLDAYRAFMHRLTQNGITSICDMSLMAHPGLDFVRDDLYAELEKRGELTVRVHMFPTLLDDMTRFNTLFETYQSPMLRTSGLKQFYDGVSSQHTAYLKEPYTNARFPGDCGRPTVPFDEMRSLVLKAAKGGFPVRIHAIGDEAIHEVLDMYAEAQETYGPLHSGFNCIEHLENFQPEDIDRLAQYDVVAAVQPGHITLDPGGPERDLGPERIKYMWPFAMYLEKGVTMAFGTDSPVVDIDSMSVLYTAVTRKDATTHFPEGGWQPQECISMADALRAYTYGSACAAGHDNLGLIAPGMLADLAVLNRDLLGEEIQSNPEKILDTHVVATYLAGNKIYEL